MMAFRLPDRLQGRDPVQLLRELMVRRGIMVPVMEIGGALWTRVSAQVYNDPRDYDRLQAIGSIR